MNKLHCAAALLLLSCGPAFAGMDRAEQLFADRKFTQAADELRPMARAGNAEAELMLGDLYGLGLLEDDPVRAAEWYARAAHKGHPRAQLRLARSYAEGRGLAKDRLRAALWAAMAELGKAEGAQAEAARLRAALTDAELGMFHELQSDYGAYFFPLSQ